MLGADPGEDVPIELGMSSQQVERPIIDSPLDGRHGRDRLAVPDKGAGA
jgi:hypothetical protein